MARKIGGLTVKQITELLGISRQTLYNYGKDPHWPGDDAPLDYIKAFVVTKKPVNGSGRKPKQRPAAAPATPTPDPAQGAPDLDQQLDDEYANLQALLNLDDELKRTVIEKNKAQIFQYQQKCLTEYRARLTDLLQRAFATVFDELKELDLTRAQLENLRRAIGRALAMLLETEKETDDDQPELDLAGAAGSDGGTE